MKKLLCVFSLCVCVYAISSAQFSYGLRVTAAPSVEPGTSYIFVNRGAANERLANITRVSYSPQLGVMGRYDLQSFWFMSDLMYGQSTSHYSLSTSGESGFGQFITLDERRSFLELPASVGVSIGIVDVFSGFSLSYDLSYKSELNEITGFSADIPKLHYGWHSGIGVNFGQILIDVRYMQEFGNYGEGRYIDGDEILLKNAPARLVMSAAYRFQG
jgi:hypothetical protein